MTSIRAARSIADFDAARALFREYADQLGVDLCFQNFATELDTLARQYAEPDGVLLLGRLAEDVVACVAVRRLDDRTAELKRLYVRDRARGNGLGRRLTETALAHAQRLGYRTILLDTLPDMRAAQALYESLGFTDTPAYYDNPIAGARYLRKPL